MKKGLGKERKGKFNEKERKKKLGDRERNVQGK